MIDELKGSFEKAIQLDPNILMRDELLNCT
jgi:hypothetical protein